MRFFLYLFLLMELCICKNTISVFDFIKNGVNKNIVSVEKDYSSEIKESFHNYIKALNNESVKNISVFFNFERYIWNSGPVFHFGENSPVVFDTPEELDLFFRDWKQSYKNITEVDTVLVNPISGGENAKVYMLDATLSRYNSNGKLIKKFRNLYYFQTNRNSGLKKIFKKWKNWTIYLVSEVSMN